MSKTLSEVSPHLEEVSKEAIVRFPHFKITKTNLTYH
jgi:hypothetical protein